MNETIVVIDTNKIDLIIFYQLVPATDKYGTKWSIYITATNEVRLPSMDLPHSLIVGQKFEGYHLLLEYPDAKKILQFL